MKKIILVLLILIIIIFIYILLLKKEQYKNKKITKLKDVILYGDDIDIKTTQNEFDIKNICIYTNDEDKTCLNLTNNNNKELPRPEGQRGQCSDDDCYKCSCPNGFAAGKNSTPSCNKKKSDENNIQCAACLPGYRLSFDKNTNNRICKPCDGATTMYPSGKPGPARKLYQNVMNYMNWSCKTCGNTDETKCPSNFKLEGCGFEEKGWCVKNECKCSNGNANELCENDEGQFCKSCNQGYYKENLSTGAKCVAVVAGSQWQPDDMHEGGARTCKSCPAGESYISKACTATSNTECTLCNKAACPANRRKTGATCTAERNAPICEACLPAGCGTKAYQTEYSCDTGSKCSPCKASSCPPGQYENLYRCDLGSYCVNNVCKCQGGYGSSGIACPRHGDWHCSKCSDNTYRKTNNLCIKNQITVYNDTWYRGASKTFEGENGGYILLKNHGWKDKISSYRKDKRAKVWFHGRDNNWDGGDGHGGDWASLENRGDNPNLQSSWNNAVDIISFGDIPYNRRKSGKEDRIS